MIGERAWCCAASRQPDGGQVSQSHGAISFLSGLFFITLIFESTEFFSAQTGAYAAILAVVSRALSDRLIVS